MAYRFKSTESPVESFRRIAAEQIDRALQALPDAQIDNDAVHSGRKALKRLRALICSAAPALGRSEARARDHALRDISRMLAQRRDADVARDALRLLEERADEATRPALAMLHTKLVQDRGGATLTPDAIATVRQQLIAQRAALCAARFKSRSMSAILAGIEDSYRKGRKAFKTAYAEPTDDSVHALRKSVQRHWRHMALLSRAWPEAFGVRVEEARRLSQVLGDDHDLAILKGAASELPPEQRRVILELCAVVQDDLRRRARPRVERLFADKPKAFGRLLAVHWRTGRRLKAVEQVDDRHAGKHRGAVAANPQPPAGDAAPETDAPIGSQQSVAAKTRPQSPSQNRA